MTILDDDLCFAKNHKPTAIILPVPYPIVYQRDGSVAYRDLKVDTDIARADALYGNFRVDTAFSNTASNYLEFAAFMSNDPTFTDLLVGDAAALSKVIVRSHDLLSAGLGAASVGKWVSIAIPPLSAFTLSVTGRGFRYFTLGQVSYTPSADWSTGGVTAYLTDKPLGQVANAYASGY